MYCLVNTYVYIHVLRSVGFLPRFLHAYKKRRLLILWLNCKMVRFNVHIDMMLSFKQRCWVVSVFLCFMWIFFLPNYPPPYMCLKMNSVFLYIVYIVMSMNFYSINFIIHYIYQLTVLKVVHVFIYWLFFQLSFCASKMNKLCISCSNLKNDYSP